MKKLIPAVLAISVLFSCATTDSGSVPVSGPVFTKPGEYNFTVKVQDVNIQNPKNDRRSYYKIYIDKIDSGRTAIGLESQVKSFSAKLSINRHLLELEKYVLDEEQGKYVKLNNIYQPKPSFVYFDILSDRIVEVTVIQDTPGNRAEISVIFKED